MRGNTQPRTAAEGDGEAAEGGHHHGRRRRIWVIGVLAVIVGGGLFALALLGVLGAIRNDLELGRSAMERGRSELGASDPEAAATSFREGRRLFAQADERANGFAVRVLGWFPILGRSADAVRAITGSAETASEAAIVLTDAAAGIPGGFSGLAPTGSALPIDRIVPLAGAAREADRLIGEAFSQVDRAPDSLLLGPVGSARRDGEEELGELQQSIHTASLLLQGLPTFLGADEPQTYFFGAQNPAELRGTGGLIGAYSILRIDHGHFRFSPFLPIHSLAQPPLGSIPAPNEDFTENYDQFRRGEWFWTSINVMPDFPSVAQAILSSYESATGEPLDGVILADPFALAALLESTGPIALRGYDRFQIDAANVVPFTTNEAYALFSDSTRRKRVLGEVARAAFERFIEQPTTDPQDLRNVLEAAGGEHLQVFSRDATMQEGLRATPVGGALRPPDAKGDLVSVVVSSSASSKVDFYQERVIRHSVVLVDDGSATASLEVTLRNEAPSSGLPAYVIGPGHISAANIGPILRTLEAGESVALMNVYCGADCIPGETRLGAEPITGAFRDDLGERYFQRYFSIPSEEEETLRLSWEDPEAWEGNSSGGVYRMTFMNQVTIRPATVSLRIAPPPGMEVASVSSPLEVIDGEVVYEGQPGLRLDVAVEFRPPVGVRLWRNVTRFLTTPLFEF
jgi:hypothetical protein